MSLHQMIASLYDTTVMMSEQIEKQLKSKRLHLSITFVCSGTHTRHQCVNTVVAHYSPTAPQTTKHTTVVVFALSTTPLHSPALCTLPGSTLTIEQHFPTVLTKGTVLQEFLPHFSQQN